MGTKLIKLWCEYDFGGDFGSNNNEDVVVVEDGITGDEIEKRLLTYLEKITCLSEGDLEGLWDWEYVNGISLNKK